MAVSRHAGRLTRALAALGPRCAGAGRLPPAAVPDKEFVIWFTARTGSTWLAALLFAAGFPRAGEYLHPNKLVRLAGALHVSGWPDYFRAVKARRAKEGIFGHKMTYQFWQALNREVDLLQHFDFSGPSIVLYREDIVSQAVSIHLSVSSGKYHRRTGTRRSARLDEVTYSEDRIRHWIDYIYRLEAGFQKHREILAPRARYISYESIFGSDPRTIIAACDRLIDPGFAVRLDARAAYEKLGSAQNQAMRDRFLAEHLDYVEELRGRRAWLFDAARAVPLLTADDAS